MDEAPGEFGPLKTDNGMVDAYYAESSPYGPLAALRGKDIRYLVSGEVVKTAQASPWEHCEMTLVRRILEAWDIAPVELAQSLRFHDNSGFCP